MFQHAKDIISNLFRIRLILILLILLYGTIYIFVPRARESVGNLDRNKQGVRNKHFRSAGGWGGVLSLKLCNLDKKWQTG